ncbi:hypothetical protein [Acidithrix ferrooxidans]|uniref:hypothetical protein n=1 Tax=Acidithrix ferrooxidans TaxID=1280514 RepID=UPI001364A51C|nr:hypothetical protein [Acidithrix ferrooxidans]
MSPEVTNSKGPIQLHCQRWGVGVEEPTVHMAIRRGQHEPAAPAYGDRDCTISDTNGAN